jgi:hypothetical protein
MMVAVFVKVAMRTLTTILALVQWKQFAAVWLAKSLSLLVRVLHLNQPQR